MGSPLSGPLACMYLEILEAGPYKNILPQECTYLRYIDDVLLICPTRTNIQSLTEKLNKIDKHIQFTYEEEENESLPFLDVRIKREPTQLTFSVYRKPTYKNDLIHFHSHHDSTIKMSTVIGFFLRAIRICSPQNLVNEYDKIRQSFEELKYLEYFIK